MRGKEERSNKHTQGSHKQTTSTPKAVTFPHVHVWLYIYNIIYERDGLYSLSVLRGLLLQTWFDKTPLGKKRKKAAQGDEGDAGAKGKGKGKGKKGKKAKKG